MSKNNRLFQQGLLLTLASIVIAAVSFAKETFFARCFGVSYVSDAYTMAIQVPEVLFAIVWETISTAVIPLYTKVLRNDGKSAAQKFFSNMLTVVCLISIVSILCGELLSEYILKLLYPGIAAETLVLATELLRWVFPMLFFEGINRVITGVMNVNDQFAVPKFLTSIRNIGIIVFLLLFTNQFGIWAAVTGLLTGIIVECLLCVILNRRYETYKPTINLNDPALKTVLIMVLPLLLGIGARELNSIVDQLVASFFETGSISSLNYARKLSSIIEVALLGNVAVLLYPRYAAFASDKNNVALGAAYVKNINICVLLSIPILLGGFFLREELVSIAFEGGAFTEEAVVLVANLFSVYLASAMFTAINGASVKLFSACCDTKTTSINAVIGVLINIVLNFALSYFMGVFGLVFATLISSVVMCFRLYYIAKKKYHFAGRPISLAVIKSVFAGILMFIALYVFRLAAVNNAAPDSFIGKFMYCLVCVVIGAGVYGVTLLLLRVDELQFINEAFKKLRRKKK